ncbi:MAG TPA: helix-turn-helix domain-containing protein [Devosiaceae bacterium]|nr:helix-turn-helix domain-containing protein [Devosiaceae bacterium]
MADEGKPRGRISNLAAHRAAGRNSAERLFRTDPAAAALVGLVAAERSVPVAALLDVGRGRASAAAARQLAMYLANTKLGLTLTEVGALFGRDRTTVAHACRLIEDHRDENDPAFDEELGRLEHAIDDLGNVAVPGMREVRHARG